MTALRVLRVLIVDDNPEVLEAMRQVIEGEHPRSTVAVRSPHVALEGITKGRLDFDIVFADLFMPSMSGDEFLGHVRDLLPSARLVLITGYTDLMVTDLEEGLVDDVLGKPVRNEVLLEVLAKATTEKKSR